MVSNGFNKKEVMLEITHRGQVLDVPVSSCACGIGSKDVFCPQWACLGVRWGDNISLLSFSQKEQVGVRLMLGLPSPIWRTPW